MLARHALSAALLLMWPIGTDIAHVENPLPLLVEAAPPAAVAITAPTKTTPPQRAFPAAAFEPFGLNAEPVLAGEIVAKWNSIETELKSERRIFARCRQEQADSAWCPPAARRFLAVVDRGMARKGRARIGIINREINFSIVPTSDLAQWGVADRWSAPIETFSTRRGDCEDYAIAKYAALRAAGMANRDIRLVVVRNNAVGEHHAVVAVRLDGHWLILDNRWLALVRDSEMRRATPLFELDDDGVRRFIGPAPAASSGKPAARS